MPFPGSGGGGPNSGPGLNPQTIYVAPNGSDSSDGRTWSTAVKTGYAGYAKIVTAGAGHLYLANGSSWGGPVDGQGCWIRGDGCVIPGWQAAVPCIIEGVGAISPNLFAEPGQSNIKGGSNVFDADFRRKPSIWLCCTNQPIVQFKNIKPLVANGHNGIAASSQTLWGWRIGWDYPRVPSTGAVDALTVLTSARAAGVTTHTVALTDIDATVTSATRTSNVTTLTIVKNGAKASFPPWNNGTWIWFESTNVNFPSGAYQVTNGASLEESNKWDFSYVDVGANHGPTATPGSVRSTQVLPNEYVDLYCDPTNFPTTNYKVIAATIIDKDSATITVVDPYGGHNGLPATVTTVANPGTLSHEERGFGQVLFPSFYNCANWLPQEFDALPRYASGPGFDFGAMNAIPPVFESCALQGYFPRAPSDNVYVEDRMSAIFCYGGAEGQSSINMRSCTGNNASLRYITGSKSGAVTIDLISDTGDGNHPPIYSAELSAFIEFNVVRADAADAIAGTADPIITGSYDPSKLRGQAFPNNVSAIMGTIGNGLSWKVPGSYTQTPWVQGKTGIWTAELRMAGMHPAGNRQISPTMARFKNLILPQASWANVHGSMTTGQDDCIGGTGAVKLTDTGDGSMYVKLRSGTDSDTSFAAGGHYVIAGWVNFPTADFNTTALYRFEAAGGSNLVWATGGASWNYQALAAVAGWQFFSASNKLISGSASQSYEIQVNGPPDDSGADAYIAFMSAFWIPPAVDENDAAEFIGTLRAQPQYLQPGFAGTFEGQKFVAHGGICTPVGTVSLGAANGKTVPWYNEAGVLQGYIELKDPA